MYSFIFPALLTLLILLCSTSKFLRKRPTKVKNEPPSPRKLPIIGNLHQLSSLPHRDLRSLARKHGPLMLLHFGSLPVLIVSSADLAREILKTHDINFADRPTNKVLRKFLYLARAVVFSPYGEYWRQARSVYVLQLLSHKKVQSFRFNREEETAFFLKKIEESPGLVDLSKMLSEFNNNGICRAALGRKLSEMENGKKFMDLLGGLSEVSGAINIGDYIPWLSWISRYNGFDGKVDKIARGVDDFLEDVIEDRLKIIKEQAGSENKNGDHNFVDVVLRDYNEKTNDQDANSIDRDSIKGMILDAFGAGTETMSVLMEWAMAELLAHPSMMDRLQREVRHTVGQGQQITDEDLEKMQYLKAVIKETLRLHPPAPLLVPRVARADVKINGYDISAGTMVMVNAWAIAREPACWDEPEEFKSERFLHSPVEFKGLHFEFIPFGAGRRGCPGIEFAMAATEFLLANIVHKFNWKLPQGEHMDMSEGPGLSVPKAVPLLAHATKP